MTTFRHVVLGTALAAPLLLAAATPAAAHPLPHAGTGVLAGSGTISPGPSVTASPQSLAFSGTLTSVGTSGVLGTTECLFSGGGSISLAGGAGTLSGACGSLSYEICAFAMVLPTTLTAVCTSTSSHTGAATLTCALRPHQVLPIESYDILCELTNALA